MKEHDKTPEEELIEVETNNLCEQQLKGIITKMIKNSGEKWMNRVRS